MRTRRLPRRLSRRSATLIACALFATAAACGGQGGPGEGESVVLVHGLGRTEQSFVVMAHRLRRAGYNVTSVGYDSRVAPVEQHALELKKAVSNCCADAVRTHFVGHSLGGIIIRRYLADETPSRLGRVVLLAPPSRGSELAEWLREFPVAAEILGPAGRSLGTGDEDVPASLPPPAYEMGIVAGNRSINPLGSAMIPGPDDGVVGLERTRVAGVPVLVLPRSHSFIMNSRHAADAVIGFLHTGSFEEHSWLTEEDAPGVHR